MSRTITSRILIALELLLAVGAMLGAWGLLRDPTGATLAGPANVLLVGTPFDDYLVPALVLFALVGTLPLFVAVSALFRMAWATSGHLVVGLVVTGWAGITAALVGLESMNQVIFLAVGVLITGLAIAEYLAVKRAPPPAIDEEAEA